MPVVNPEKLVSLQHKADNVRNICILAHVDHGKTSLTDSLIATNGIISPKLAGKIRYLDSRPDEQIRGITMESSAISLYFSMMRRNSPDEKLSEQEYLINLIDSPGHIDFSSEVSTASRLCDGAVVLVDAVEGVCSQTVTVLRQTWIEHLKPILVINKIDRLIWELKMSPAEAYVHLSKIVEQVNAVIGSFFQGERMEEDLQWREKMDERVKAQAERAQRAVSDASDPASQISDIDPNGAAEFEERDDEDLYFAPEKNNVIFSSAIDGWAFTIRQFSGIYEKKLGIKRSVIEKVLWGDFYMDPKTKRILGQKHLKGRNLKPMFVQLVLEPIWKVYEATTGGGKDKGDPMMLDKITKSLSIALPNHLLRSKDTRAVLLAVFSAWLPLSTALLVSVIEYLPSPPTSQAARLPEMIEETLGSSHIAEDVRDAMVSFKSAKGEPAVAYVSKMVSIPESELPEKKRRPGGTMTAEEARELARKKRAEIAKAQAGAEGDDVFGVSKITEEIGATRLDEAEQPEAENLEHLIGFARLYSGTLSVGDSVYVLNPKFSPATPHAEPEPQKITIAGLYLLMGRSLEALDSVPAGVVFGIAGLAGHVLKTGTLCSQLEGGINLAGVNLATPPIVRVALEPVHPGDLSKMVSGLKLLEQSDPCAVYEVLESGEHVILTAGELHLERCLKDLRERFAKCEVQAGDPIVPYRETIVNALDMPPAREKDLPRGTVVASTASDQVTVRLRVRPLPVEVTEYLGKNTAAIRQFYSERHIQAAVREENGTADQQDPNDADDNTGSERVKMSLVDFKRGLQAAFDESGDDKDVWKDVIEDITAFGPRRVGPNMLIDVTDTCHKFLREDHENSSNGVKASDTSTSLQARDLSTTIAYAFQLAMFQGPLCAEPVQGTAVLLEEVIVNPNSEAESTNVAALTGSLLKTIRSSISTGFMDWSPRILLATYSCEINTPPEAMGRVYPVISRRRGRVVSEDMREGTPFFTISSLLPVAESFGFSDEIRKRTSGAAIPQLVFHGFETVEGGDVDPRWVPQTEEELEDFGEMGDRENLAKKYVDAVRDRKGMRRMMVKGGIGQGGRDPEKQKTLKR